ncbi:hypothetical protein LWI28_004871 [Acer negundo]|uniref:Uncharacterized protein n=1 Tax=Acer negundo TaxID=4023 RepID=A0AAD5JLJ4_ACENE|nr:hypothetical protein LWI28_004871 [Acer negundo]
MILGMIAITNSQENRREIHVEEPLKSAMKRRLILVSIRATKYMRKSQRRTKRMKSQKRRRMMMATITSREIIGKPYIQHLNEFGEEEDLDNTKYDYYSSEPSSSAVSEPHLDDNFGHECNSKFMGEQEKDPYRRTAKVNDEDEADPGEKKEGYVERALILC